MPAQNRIRSHDAGQLLQHLSPEDLASNGQTSPLVAAGQDSVLSELLLEDPIFRQEILDGLKEQQFQRTLFFCLLRGRFRR